MDKLYIAIYFIAMGSNHYNYLTSQIDSPVNGFCAKLSNPKVLVQILKVLNFRDDVTINVGVNGLKVTAEISKSFQANAFIQRETFIEYNVSEEIQEEQDDTTFNISLNTLIHCLNLCGTGSGNNSHATTSFPGSNTNTIVSSLSTTSMMLYYSELGDPLRIWLEEDGIISGSY